MNQEFFDAEKAVEGALQQNPELLEKIRRDHERPATELPHEKAASTESWPVVADEAFQGLAGDVVRAIDPFTEAAPVATLTNFLAGFGNQAGRGPHATVLSDQHPARFFVAQIGDTSKGRKGTGWGPVRQMLQACDTEWRTATGLSSGEGLIDTVRDAVQEYDAKKGEYQLVDPGVVDKRLLVIEPEFATVLRMMERTGNSLSGVLRQAWDGDTLSPLTKGNRISATGSNISIIGHCTCEELTRYLPETERANGFANRFAFFLIRRSKEIPNPKPIPQSTMNDLISRIHSALEFAKEISIVERDAAADREWVEVYSALSAGKPGMAGCILNRAEAQVLRLSVAYALLDRSELIRPEHQRAALALWDYSEESVRRIFGDATGNPVADRIMRDLRERGEMDRTEIINLFSRNQAAATIDRALALLEKARMAHGEQVSTGGRPKEVWKVGATK